MGWDFANCPIRGVAKEKFCCIDTADLYLLAIELMGRATSGEPAKFVTFSHHGGMPPCSTK
jgi:hypothetical protein